MRGLRLAFVAVWVLGGTLTVLNGVDASTLALRSPASSAVLETVAAGGATLLAALSYGRWHERALLADLVACNAFSILAIGNVAFGLIPLLMQPRAVSIDVRTAGLLCGAVAAVAFAIAAVLPRRQFFATRRYGFLGVMLPVVLVVGGLTLAVAVSSSTPFPGLNGVASTEATSAAGIHNVMALQAAIGFAFAFASVGFM